MLVSLIDFGKVQAALQTYKKCGGVGFFVELRNDTLLAPVSLKVNRNNPGLAYAGNHVEFGAEIATPARGSRVEAPPQAE